MKNKIKKIILFVFVLVLFGCVQEKNIFEKTSYQMYVDESLSLIPMEGISKEEVEYKIEDDSIITIEEGVVTALKEGTTSVEATYKRRKSTLNFKIVKEEKDLILCKEYELFEGNHQELTFVDNISSNQVDFKIENQSIISIEFGIITALKEGTTSVEASYQNRTTIYKSSLTIKVNKKLSLFEKINYTLEEGEIIELKPIEGVSLDDIKFKVETNDIISFNKGEITALKKGEVTIEAENEYFKSILIIKVIPRSIKVEDIEQNTLLYNELTNKIEEFNEKMKNEEYVSSGSNFRVNNIETHTIERLRTDKIYYELFDISLGSHSIIKEINDNVYMFGLKDFENKAFSLDYVGTVDEIKEIYNLPLVKKIIFSPQKGNIEKENNIFIIESYFEDYLEEATKNEISEIYNQFGISTEEVYKSIINLKYEFKEDRVLIEVTTKFTIKDNNGNSQNFDICINNQIAFIEFKEFDENSEDYIIESPSSFEEIYKITDAKENNFEVFTTDSYVGEAYFKSYIEKGQYILTDSTDVDIWAIEVFDENMNKVKVQLDEVAKSWNLDDQLNFFAIPDDGYYYLHIRFDARKKIIFELLEVEYETNPLDLIEDNPTRMTGKIEGYGDIAYYTFTNETQENKVIKIYNNSQETIEVASKRYGQEKMELDRIFKENSLYFLLKPGINDFYVMNNGYYYYGFDVHHYAHEYDLIITEVDCKFSPTGNNDYIEITQEFSEDCYAVGGGLDELSFVLDVKEYGYYKFESELLEDTEDIWFEVYDEEGLEINSENQGFVLKEGSYVVKAHENPYEMSIFKVKYTFYSLDDLEIDVELPTLDFSNEYFWDGARYTIENKKIAEIHRVKYVFVLNETTTIYYDVYDTYIYEYETEKLISNNKDNVYTYYDTITLKAGKYYVEAPNLGGYSAKIKVAKLTNYQEDCIFDYYNPIILSENEEKTFSKDWYYDVDIVKIIISEDSTIYVKGAMLLDSEYNRIKAKDYPDDDNQGTCYEVKAGEYYLKIAFSSKETTTVSYYK